MPLGGLVGNWRLEQDIGARRSSCTSRQPNPRLSSGVISANKLTQADLVSLRLPTHDRDTAAGATHRIAVPASTQKQLALAIRHQHPERTWHEARALWRARPRKARTCRR